MKMILLAMMISVSALAQESGIKEFREEILRLTDGKTRLEGIDKKTGKPCDVAFSMTLKEDTSTWGTYTDYLNVVVNTKIKYSRNWGNRYRTTVYSHGQEEVFTYEQEAITVFSRYDRGGPDSEHTLIVRKEGEKITSVKTMSKDFGLTLAERVMSGSKKQQECLIQ